MPHVNNEGDWQKVYFPVDSSFLMNYLLIRRTSQPGSSTGARLKQSARRN